jgi:hypothetical protein
MALLINAKLPMQSQVEAVRNLSILYYFYGAGWFLGETTEIQST